MNAATSACAPPDVVWDDIPWDNVRRQVRRLQTRIVKATQDGKHNKVKALQWLLTHSFSGKALAVKRVTENKGKNTSGVDKVVWKTPRAKSDAIISLKRHGYSSLPLRRVLIPKKNGKTRPLGIPVMKCRAMQALYLLALEPIAETTADLNSYGFRPERSTADAGEQCFKSLAKKVSAQWVLEADIQGCFDAICHDWMLANIPVDKVLLKKWLKAGFVYQNELFPTDTGTPQGGIISPVAANMALDGLETVLAEKFPTAKRLSGWNIRKYNGKLLIKPSKTNVKNHLGKIREVIKANKSAKQVNLIKLLNPILRGWANYHCHIVAKKTFARNDQRVWSMLWRWAVRRHPNKGARWIKDKYFKTRGSRNWVFTATEKRKDGTQKEHVLRYQVDTPIKRHLKIKAHANPHDPQWEQYFESRWGKKMLNSTKGRRKLYRIWQRQEGLCSSCQKPITKQTPWNIRSIRVKNKGRTKVTNNLQMHHLNCRSHSYVLKNKVV